MPVQRDIPDILNFMIAKDALTEIPATPIPGIAYRNASLSAADFEAGQKYSNVYESSLYNQQNYLLSAYGSMVGKYGVLPFQIGQPYAESGRCIGPDGKLYRALQDIAADTSPFPVPGQAGSEDYWAVDIPENIALNLNARYETGLYVDYSATSNGDGSSWDTAFSTVTAALEYIRTKYASPILMLTAGDQIQTLVRLHIKGKPGVTTHETLTISFTAMAIDFQFETADAVEWTIVDKPIGMYAGAIGFRGGAATANLTLNISSEGGLLLENTSCMFSNINLTAKRADGNTVYTLFINGLQSYIGLTATANITFSDLGIAITGCRIDVLGTITMPSWSTLTPANAIIATCSDLTVQGGTIKTNSMIPFSYLRGLWLTGSYLQAYSGGQLVVGSIELIGGAYAYLDKSVPSNITIGFDGGGVIPDHGVVCQFAGSIRTYLSPLSAAVLPAKKGVIDFNSTVDTGGLIAQTAWPGTAAWDIITARGGVYY